VDLRIEVPDSFCVLTALQREESANFLTAASVNTAFKRRQAHRCTDAVMQKSGT
jgi:hypothetical protein